MYWTGAEQREGAARTITFAIATTFIEVDAIKKVINTQLDPWGS